MQFSYWLDQEDGDQIEVEVHAELSHGCKPTFYDPGEPPGADIQECLRADNKQEYKLTPTERETLEAYAMQMAYEDEQGREDFWTDIEIDEAQLREGG
jgi:hypothetical protein